MAWIKRFTQACYPFRLDRVDVLIGHASTVSVGRAIRLLVYGDPSGSGDPANATLLHSEDTTVQVVSASVWNEYTLSSPVLLTAGDVYVGVYDLEADAPTTYIASVDFNHAHSRWLASWWEAGFDLLLTPTCAEPPPPLGSFAATPDNPLAGYLRAAPFGAFTMQFNTSGQPAISLPLHWNEEGLPIGVQLVAAYGREDLLIRVAAQIEKAEPWIARLPPVHASRL